MTNIAVVACKKCQNGSSHYLGVIVGEKWWPVPDEVCAILARIPGVMVLYDEVNCNK